MFYKDQLYKQQEDLQRAQEVSQTLLSSLHEKDRKLTLVQSLEEQLDQKQEQVDQLLSQVEAYKKRLSDHSSMQHSLQYEIHEGNQRAAEYREIARDEGLSRIEMLKQVDQANLENDRLQRELRRLEAEAETLRKQNRVEV